jgi:hypothetical protein
LVDNLACSLDHRPGSELIEDLWPELVNKLPPKAT